MGVGPRDAVDQEAGQAHPAGEGVGNGARLVLRASEIPGPPRARGALPRGIPELDHDRAPVARIGGEGLGTARVGPLHHPGADRETARRLREHRYGESPGGHRARGDQAGAGHRARQRRPPSGPPHRPAGPASQQGREGERQRDGGACQYRQHLPADPHHTQHDRGQQESRPRRDRDAWACSGGSQRATTSATAPSRASNSGGDMYSPAMISFTPPSSGRDTRGHIGPRWPSHATAVAVRGRSDVRPQSRPGMSPVRPESPSGTPDRRPLCDRGSSGTPPAVVPRHAAIRRWAHVLRGPGGLP